MLRTWMLSLLAVCLLGADAPPTELMVGQMAPKLAVQEFVKGEPVTKFEKGEVYVIEFWATWCGPCVQSIPLLTELQHKFPKVKFIGIDVLENDLDTVREFVAKQKAKMDYRVAIDKPGPMGEEVPGSMAKGWIEASYRQGIPATFVIDQTGRVAWIGHPFELEKPLQRIVDGKWDLAAAAKKHAAEVIPVREKTILERKFAKAREAGGTPADLVRVLDESFERYPPLQSEYGSLKIILLMGEPATRPDAVEYGKYLITEVHQENLVGLADLAIAILNQADGTPRKVHPEIGRLALLAVQTAQKVPGDREPEDNAGLADLMAQCYYALGDFPKAVATQRQALKLAEKTHLEDDEDMLARMKRYDQAAAAAPKAAGIPKAAGTAKPTTRR